MKINYFLAANGLKPFIDTDTIELETLIVSKLKEGVFDGSSWWND